MRCNINNNIFLYGIKIVYSLHPTNIYFYCNYLLFAIKIRNQVFFVQMHFIDYFISIYVYCPIN
jgi:hypothetical protein